MPTSINQFLPYANAAGIIPSAPTQTSPTTLGQFYTNTGIGTGNVVGTAQLNNQTQPSPVTGGGGSQPARDPHINPATGVWDDNYFARNNAPSNDEVNRLIDENYGASEGYLNQAEGQLRDNFNAVPGQLEENFNYNSGLAGTQRDKSNTDLNVYADKNAYANENALAASRRLYNELRQGAQQRFGGSSSAGEAAGEILGVEQQRQQGQTQRSYQDEVRKINSAHQEINSKYDQTIVEFKRDKDQQLQAAQQSFQAKLLEIAGKRAENASAKASAKLQALQDLRNKIFQINLQDMQFQQQLTLNRNNALSTVNAYAAQVGNATQGVSDSYNQALQSPGYNNNPTSSLSYGQAPQQNQAAPYVGAIQTGKRDQYGNLI